VTAPLLRLAAAALPVWPTLGCDGQDSPCEARPLDRPTFELRGIELDERGAVEFSGRVESRESSEEGGHHRDALTIDAGERGRIEIAVALPRKVAFDLEKGREVKVVFRRTRGFQGRATGLAIRDSVGVVLLADDGEYGNALRPAETAPFKISQEDAGCRNRRNHPGDLNNFRLVVEAGESTAKLMHGETGELRVGEARYAVLAIRSVSRVGGVRWTDSPYEYRAFAIGRIR
jgi:hypothetical protein